VQAGHAGTAAAAASRIESTRRLAGKEVLKESVEGGLEDGLETPEDEVTA
jgi:hypothetical protein